MLIVLISYGSNDKREFKQKASLLWLKRAGWHKGKHMMVKLLIFIAIITLIIITAMLETGADQ